jgi:hypothetical protein
MIPQERCWFDFTNELGGCYTYYLQYSHVPFVTSDGPLCIQLLMSHQSTRSKPSTSRRHYSVLQSRDHHHFPVTVRSLELCPTMKVYWPSKTIFQFCSVTSQ